VEKPRERVLRATLEELLRVPGFFYGNAPEFGLRFVYQVEDGFELVYGLEEMTRLSIQGIHGLRFHPQ
jgi:hypothetical protein